MTGTTTSANVSELNKDDLTGTIWITNDELREQNIVHAVTTAHKGKRTQNEDGSWPDAITSKENANPEKQELHAGVTISMYRLQGNERYTIEEVWEDPRRYGMTDSTLETERNHAADPESVPENPTEILVEDNDFMFWDDFKSKFSEYRILD